MGIDEAIENTLKLIEDAKEQKYEIFFIQHISTREGATFFLPNSEGVKLHTRFDVSVSTVVQKNYPNSFRETTLQEKLQEKGIKDIIICGAMSHMCVDTTVRAAFDLGYNVELISDACATKDLVFHGETIRAKDVHSTFIASLDGVFCEVKIEVICYRAKVYSLICTCKREKEQ